MKQDFHHDDDDDRKNSSSTVTKQTHTHIDNFLGSRVTRNKKGQTFFFRLRSKLFEIVIIIRKASNVCIQYKHPVCCESFSVETDRQKDRKKSNLFDSIHLTYTYT